MTHTKSNLFCRTGLALIIVGTILNFTIIGMILGIPMLLFGFISLLISFILYVQNRGRASQQN